MEVMEPNITEQQYLDGDLQLAEPHFDEEATVAAARPVVPLQEITAAAGFRRRLALGLSIVISLMVGALGATLIYKQRGQRPAAVIVDSAVTGFGASEHSATHVASMADAKEGVAGVAERADYAPAADQKPEPRAARRIESPRAETKQTQPVSWADKNEMRRTARVEARRFRGKEEREARREDRRKRKSDDLLRIREIFEGSPRP